MIYRLSFFFALLLPLLALPQCREAKNVRIYLSGDAREDDLLRIAGKRFERTTRKFYEGTLDQPATAFKPRSQDFNDERFQFTVSNSELVTSGQDCFLSIEVKCERKKDLIVQSKPDKLRFQYVDKNFTTNADSKVPRVFPQYKEISLMFTLDPDRNFIPPVLIKVNLSEINLAQSRIINRDRSFLVQKAAEAKVRPYIRGDKFIIDNATKAVIEKSFKFNDLTFELRDSD